MLMTRRGLHAQPQRRTKHHVFKELALRLFTVDMCFGISYKSSLISAAGSIAKMCCLACSITSRSTSTCWQRHANRSARAPDFTPTYCAMPKCLCRTTCVVRSKLDRCSRCTLERRMVDDKKALDQHGISQEVHDCDIALAVILDAPERYSTHDRSCPSGGYRRP